MQFCVLFGVFLLAVYAQGSPTEDGGGAGPLADVPEVDLPKTNPKAISVPKETGKQVERVKTDVEDKGKPCDDDHSGSPETGGFKCHKNPTNEGDCGKDYVKTRYEQNIKQTNKQESTNEQNQKFETEQYHKGGSNQKEDGSQADEHHEGSKEKNEPQRGIDKTKSGESDPVESVPGKSGNSSQGKSGNSGQGKSGNSGQGKSGNSRQGKPHESGQTQHNKPGVERDDGEGIGKVTDKKNIEETGDSSEESSPGHGISDKSGHVIRSGGGSHETEHEPNTPHEWIDVCDTCTKSENGKQGNVGNKGRKKKKRNGKKGRKNEKTSDGKGRQPRQDHEASDSENSSSEEGYCYKPYSNTCEPCDDSWECETGYLYPCKKDCVEDNICGKHQHYKFCGTACPLTCENCKNPPRICHKGCVEGCFCDNGYVLKRNGSKDCVKQEECKKGYEQESTDIYDTNWNGQSSPDDRGIGEESEGDFDATSYEESEGDFHATSYEGSEGDFDATSYEESGVVTHAGQESSPETSDATEGTRVTKMDEKDRRNYGQRSSDVTDSETSKTTEGTRVTHKTGSERDERDSSRHGQDHEASDSENSSREEGYCYNPYSKTCKPCDYWKCERKYWHPCKKDCVEARICGKHQEYLDRGTACPLTCENYKNPPKICDKKCVEGCFCKKGYVLNRNGSKEFCVKSNACPKCGNNEEYKFCKTNCEPTCKHPIPRSCNKLPCKPGCQCKEGYVRNNEGKCVPTQCPKECRDNEEYKKCGTACPKTCDTLYEEKPCTKNCVQGWFCKKGYVREYKGGKCVPIFQCPKFLNCFLNCLAVEVLRPCGEPKCGCQKNSPVMRCIEKCSSIKKQQPRAAALTKSDDFESLDYSTG